MCAKKISNELFSMPTHRDMDPSDPRRMLLNIPPLAATRIECNTRTQKRGKKGAMSDSPAEVEYVITARADAKFYECFYCFGGDLEESFDNISVLDLPLHGKRTTIRSTLGKYRCRQCERHFSMRMIGIEPARKMTTRLRRALEDLVLTRRYDHLAEDYGVSESTIRNIADELIDALEKTWVVRTPRVLGIDDVKIGKKSRTIFADSETGEILHIADSKLRKDVISGLRLFCAEKIEAVTMDMDEAYRPVVRKALPDAVIIFDKFHVVQRANVMMTDFQKAWQRTRDSISTPGGSKWKRAFLLRRRNVGKPRHDLIDEGHLPNIPLLKAAYELKESFLELLDLPSCSDAIEGYKSWRARARHWIENSPGEVVGSELRAQLRRHLVSFTDLVDNETRAFFGGLDQGLHNARVERANGMIRAIEGIGQGFSYDIIKARAVYGRVKASRDLVECDICLRRYNVSLSSSATLPRPWNLYDPHHELEERLCEACWDRFIAVMSSTPPGEASPSIIPEDAVRPRVRARNRIQTRRLLIVEAQTP